MPCSAAAGALRHPHIPPAVQLPRPSAHHATSLSAALFNAQGFQLHLINILYILYI